MKFLGLVLSNLRRKRLRTALTILSILVAFVLFGYLAAIRVALSQGIDVAGADRLVVRHKVSIIQPLPVSYMPRMQAIDGVDTVIHQTWFGGIYQDPKNFFAQMPVEPDELLDMYPEYLLSDEERDAWTSTRTGAVVGTTTAERFGWSVGDRIPIDATVWQREDGGTLWEFDLVGIYDGAKKGTDLTTFFFRYDYFDEARVYGKGQVGWYIVRVDDPERSAELAESIDREFANSMAETKTETEGAFLQGFAKQIGNIAAILAGILAAVFFTILLVAGNTMGQSVRERTNELALFKSIGFTHGGVMLLVLAESMAVAALGGLAGLAISFSLISLGDPTGGALPVFYFPTRDLLFGVVLVGLLGLATGIFPALEASRLRIADALRR